MKIIKTIALLIFGFYTLPVIAAVNPSLPIDEAPVFDMGKIKSKEIEKLTGKKLNLLQKVQFKIFQKKLRKYEEGEITEKQKKKATWSMILGIASIVLLFIPFIGILALPAAILALIFGIQSVKGNANTKSIIGIVTGSVTLVLFLIALAFFAAYMAALG